MANTFYREPIDGGDTGIWGPKELRQNRIAFGIKTSKVYDDSGTLKLSKGLIGISDGAGYGIADVDTITTISLATISNSQWFKVEISHTGTVVNIDVSSISTLTQFFNAFDHIKGGYYITASKRCIAIGYKNAAGDITGLINTKSNDEGYVGTNLDNKIMLTLGDEDFTIQDGFKNLEIFLPASGITANRTITLPTLADNQDVKIKLQNFNTTYALFVDGEGAETVEGFATINLSTEWIQLQGESSGWKRIGQQDERPVAYFEDQQANNTQGGASTSGSFQTRVLNTEMSNSIIGCSLATNTITLPVGRYEINSKCGFFQSDGAKTRIQDTTTPATIVLAINSYTSGSDGSVVFSEINYTFTVTQITNIELQYRVTTAKATNGLGVAHNFSIDEIYSRVKIKKLI